LNVLNKMVQFPLIFAQSAILKLEKYQYETSILRKWEQVSVDPAIIEKIKSADKTHSNKQPVSSLPSTEQQIISKIKQKKKLSNVNNITRTKAYLDFYEKHPEIHWALLAHLVSRNGGWNMTDLKGELSEVLHQTKKIDFFMFLETANALIFHDAYPQLLLYEESKKQGQNLFHLLPYFHVSSFMLPIWNHFFEYKDSKLLTISLIINEQHYIEERVIKNSIFQEKVLNTILFQAQEFLQITQVIFPFEWNENNRMTGLSISNFSSVSNRIEIGKKLYALLFGVSPLFEDISTFVRNTPHTGSRQDYWPNYYSTKKQKDTRKKIWSPLLEMAWPNINHSFTDSRDWFHHKDQKVYLFYKPVDLPPTIDITVENYRKIQKIHLAILTYKNAKQLL